MGNTISDIYINLNNALKHCNEALARKGIEAASTVYDIADKIKLIEVDNSVRNSIIEGTITELSDEKVSIIGDYAFYGCTSLTSTDLPVCSYISYGAFSGCTSLVSVNLPVCSYVGNEAFYGCKSLTSIDLPVCSYISYGAFSSCTSLTSIILRYSSVVTLKGENALFGTPMSKSTFTGSFGSIYVPASLVDAYKTALNWSAYADRITALGVPKDE